MTKIEKIMAAVLVFGLIGFFFSLKHLGELLTQLPK